MLRLDELLVVAIGQTLRVGQRLLKLGGEFVDTHLSCLPSGIFR
jgi:hypothetical protein